MISLQDILLLIETNLTPRMVWVFGVIFLVLIALASLIALWHWSSYGIGFLRKAGVEAAYIAITGVLAVFFVGAVIHLMNLL